MLKEITTTEIEATILANPVLREVRAMYREQGATDKLAVLETQTFKGLEKYGHAVNYREKTAAEWEQFRLEEEVDGDVYAVCKAMCELADSMNKLDKADQEDVLNQMASKYGEGK